MIIPLNRRLAGENEIRQFLLIMLRETRIEFTIHADLDKLRISVDTSREDVLGLIRQLAHMGLINL